MTVFNTHPLLRQTIGCIASMADAERSEREAQEYARENYIDECLQEFGRHGFFEVMDRRIDLDDVLSEIDLGGPKCMSAMQAVLVDNDPQQWQDILGAKAREIIESVLKEYGK